eukprot:Gb_35807 [translate_table: standard]
MVAIAGPRELGRWPEGTKEAYTGRGQYRIPRGRSRAAGTDEERHGGCGSTQQPMGLRESRVGLGQDEQAQDGGEEARETTETQGAGETTAQTGSRGEQGAKGSEEKWKEGALPM